MFIMLDIDNDGLITVNEIYEHFDRIVKLSQKEKDGFFAYLDNSKIGMVDYKRWLEVLNIDEKTRISPIQEQDNFEW